MEQQSFPCYNCGYLNLVGQPFCGNCGQPLYYNCPSCGAPVNSTVIECPQCHIPLYWPGRQVAPVEPVHQQYQYDSPPAQYPTEPQYYEETSETSRKGPGKLNLPAVIGLGVLAVLIVITGILYATGTVPAFLSSSQKEETAGSNNDSPSTNGNSSLNTDSLAISSPTASSIEYNSAVITWITNELATSQVEYGTSTSYGMESQLDESPTKQHSVTLTGLSPDTKYYFRVLSKDENGNQATSSNSNFTTISSPDTKLPVISAISANVTATAATIHWTTDKLCTGQINYGKTSSYGSSSALSQTLVTQHTVDLSGLSSDTTYHYRVRSKDSSGNEVVSSDMQFKTSPEDKIAPKISGVTYEISDNTTTSWEITITWVTDEPASSEVQYGTSQDDLDDTSGEQDTTTRKLSHSVSIDLDPDIKYYYKVISKDSQGNQSESYPSAIGPFNSS